MQLFEKVVIRMAQSITPEQMEALLRYASRRLNTTPEELARAFQQNGLHGLAQQAKDSGLTPEQTAQMQTLLENQTQIAQLMNDPRVQELLRRLAGRD